MVVRGGRRQSILISHRGASYVRPTDSDILGSEHHLWGERAEYWRGGNEMGVQEVGLCESGIELSKLVVCMWERFSEPMPFSVVYHV